MAEPIRINLWELLTHASTCPDTPRHYREEYEKIQRALGKSARWNGQEITLESVPEGWIIEVSSCYSDRFPGDEVGDSPKIVVTIPKNGYPTVKEI